MRELLKRLNQNNNFHLAFKVIQIDDENIIKNVSNDKTYIIKGNDDLFDKLLYAYNNNFKWIICDEKVQVLLPILTVITKDNCDIIKPFIPVYYYLKDNRIIQKVKTACNKKSSAYLSFKNTKELETSINDIIK